MYILIILEIRIPRASKGLTGERIYDKIHYSLFCNLPGKKLADTFKHATRMSWHKNASRSSEKGKTAAARPAKDSWGFLPKYGCFKDRRRSYSMVDAIVNVNDYIPCKFCLAFLLKSDLWKHVQGCPFKEEIIDEKNLVSQAQL